MFLWQTLHGGLENKLAISYCCKSSEQLYLGIKYLKTDLSFHLSWVILKKLFLLLLFLFYFRDGQKSLHRRRSLPSVLSLLTQCVGSSTNSKVTLEDIQICHLNIIFEMIQFIPSRSFLLAPSQSSLFGAERPIILFYFLPRILLS